MGEGLTWTYPINPGKGTGIQTDYQFLGETNDSLLFLLTFGTDTPGGINIKEMGFNARINRLTNGETGLFRTFYYPTESYAYGQVIGKNGSNSHLILDNIYPVLEP